MSQIVLYFLHSISVPSFHIDVILTLSILYALNTGCDYFIEDIFLKYIAEKNQYKNKSPLCYNNVNK